MNHVLNLSLHGSVAFIVVWVLDALLADRMGAAYRRWWWIAIPFAFLVAIRVPVLPALAATPLMQSGKVWLPLEGFNVVTNRTMHEFGGGAADFLFAVWLAGVVIYLLVVTVQTRMALRCWSRERLSTDSGLLDVLEDCKQEVRITAPIGLVLSAHVSAPAILGWLRPRILLPAHRVTSLSRPQLRAVFFHELAHFRSLDIPLNWLFTLACAVHWFNPVAHLAFRGWTRFREEAADETAMTWMQEPSTYGEALLQTLRQANGGTLALQSATILMTTSPDRWEPAMTCTMGGVLVVPQNVTQEELESLKDRHLPFLIVGRSNLCGPRIVLNKEHPVGCGESDFYSAGRRAAEILSHSAFTGSTVLDLMIYPIMPDEQSVGIMPMPCLSETERSRY